MLRALFVLVLLLWSTALLAQSAQNFYIAGGLMSQRMTGKIRSEEVFDGQHILIDSSLWREGSGGSVVVGYQFQPSTHSMATVEVGRDIVASGTFSSHGESGLTNSAGPNVLDVHWKMSPNWFFALKPGVRISESLIAYVSVAYHSADIDLSRTAQFGRQNTTRSSVRSVGGTGIGIGFQSAISHHWFVRGEIENIRFSDIVIDWTPANSTGGDLVSRHGLKPEALVGRLIFGYRF